VTATGVGTREFHVVDRDGTRLALVRAA
jgi:hypothetical protein